MGQVQCKKCGVPLDYYKGKQIGNSCRVHYNDCACRKGNCFHAWSFQSWFSSSSFELNPQTSPNIPSYAEFTHKKNDNMNSNHSSNCWLFALHHSFPSPYSRHSMPQGHQKLSHQQRHQHREQLHFPQKLRLP